MFEELQNLVNALPFVPFTIDMSSGRNVVVSSRENIIVGSKGLVVVENDEGLFDLLPIRHITAVTGRTQDA
jgi:hypothetical protein